MAAGLSLEESRLEEFRERFDSACRAKLTPAQLERVMETDGELAPGELVLETALALTRCGPWGQGMPEPLFEGLFEVRAARTVGADQSHVRYRLRDAGGQELVAVHFSGAEKLRSQGRVRVAYALSINRWQGSESLELRVEHLEAA